ncbi:MAG: GNAT family N-acetyltransferase [Sphingomonadaceae bacterium]
MAAHPAPIADLRTFDPASPDPALLRAWQRLDAAAGSPMQASAFALAVGATLLAGTPLALAVSEGSAGIEALLPLVLAAGPLTRWRLAGPRETSEPSDALCGNAPAAARLAASLAALRQPLSLDRIPADSPLVPALRQALRGRALVSVRPAQPSPAIALGPDWHEPESRFNAGRRSDFRRAARKAAGLGTVTYEFACPDPAEFEARFDEAVAVEGRSWKTAAGTALAVDLPRQAFFRAYLGAECARGALRLGVMRIDGQAVAIQLAVESGGRLWLYKIGYDEAYRKCSPGTLLLLHTAGAAARAGLASIELLGNPEPWIAELWTRDERPCLRVRTYPFSLAGAAALLADGGEWLRARLGGGGR